MPLIFAVYYLVPRMEQKNTVLLIASLVLYAFGQLYYLPLLLLTAYLNYRMSDYVTPDSKRSLILPLALNIGVLVVFKYLNFLLGIFGVTGADGGGAVALVAPIGISFYTFQLISYHIDVYREKCEPAENFKKFLLFLSMFPKMPMGPIVRYAQIESQLYSRKIHPRAVFQGLVRFAVGLAKKVLIADYAYNVYQQFSLEKYGAAAWLAALFFMFYIYFEFSGCTDMAIALGRMFGFRFPENFDVPYASSSITEFWRRWHITLGSFFRDYVYIPLGGNRKGLPRQILNLLVVWVLTGLWHGAHWNYLIWGLYFFVLLTAEKLLMPKLNRLPFAARNLITMLFVLFGWVIFANEDLSALGKALGLMFGAGSFWGASVGVLLKNALPLLALCLIGSSVLPRWIGAIWSNVFLCGTKGNRITVRQCVYALGMLLFAAVLLYLCTASLAGAASKPSLYATF